MSLFPFLISSKYPNISLAVCSDFEISIGGGTSLAPFAPAGGALLP